VLEPPEAINIQTWTHSRLKLSTMALKHQHYGFSFVLLHQKNRTMSNKPSDESL